MKAVISNYRRGRHTQKGNHVVLVSESVKTKKDAEKLKGKEISWKNASGTEIKGKIAAAHGNSGAFRAIMERGIPGQAVGTEVEVK